MNDLFKYGLVLTAGVALGAAAVLIAGKGKLDLKPMAADLISRGLNLKDSLVGKLESLKEDLEDMTAAAKQKADAAKTQASSSGE